ncbi:MAG: hypothetical protein RLZZ81_909 [Pseudomonadota bacterium]|jgi:hypothetical protein
MTENIYNDIKFGNLENYENELINTALKENDQNKLKEYYENITQALNNIREYEYEAKATQYREMLDDARTYDKSTADYQLGSAHFITASGYKALLGAYKALNPDENTDKKLDHFMGGLDEIYKQSVLVSNLTNSTKLPPAEQLKNFLEKTTDEIYDKLQKTGESYLSYTNAPTNTGLHANVIKYSKEDGKIYRTFYNAGGGAVSDNLKLDIKSKAQLPIYKENELRYTPLFSTIKYEFKEQSDKGIKNVISREIENNVFSILFSKNKNDITSLNDKIKKANLEDFINPTANTERIVTGQTLGNCSSRSIREALRDNVPDSEFREIYDFITQNQVSQIILNLEKEQKHLANTLNITLIKEPEVKDQHLTNKTDLFINTFQEEINKGLNLSTDKSIGENKLAISNSILRYEPVAQTEFAKINAKHFLATGLVKKDQTQKDTPTISAINYFDDFFYKEGHTQGTKERLFNKIAYKEAEFKNSNGRVVDLLSTIFPYKDNDLPITEDLLNPTIKHIKTCFEDHGITSEKTFSENLNLYRSNKEQIIKELSEKCLNDKDLNILIKAQVQAKIENRPAIDIFQQMKQSNTNPKPLELSEEHKKLDDVIKDMAQKYKMTIPEAKASEEITQVIKDYSENKFNEEITPIKAQKLVDEFTQQTLDIFGENKLIDSPIIETKNEHINIPLPNVEKQEPTNLNLYIVPEEEKQNLVNELITEVNKNLPNNTGVSEDKKQEVKTDNIFNKNSEPKKQTIKNKFYKYLSKLTEKLGLKSISNYFKELIKDPNLEQNINLEKEAKLIAEKHRLTKYMELSDNKNNNAVFSGKKTPKNISKL